MKKVNTKKKYRFPFLWSIFLSFVAVGLIQFAAISYRFGERLMGHFLTLAGFALLLIEILIFIPLLFRQAFPERGVFFHFRLTRSGTIYLALTGFISLAAINTGNNLLYLVIAFMLGMILTSGLISWRILTDLRVSVSCQDTIVAGEFTAYRLILSNNKRWFHTFSVTMTGELINQTWALSHGLPVQHTPRQIRRLSKAGVPCIHISGFFPLVRVGQSEQQTFTLTFPERGLYRIERIVVATSFPFGLFRKGQPLPVQGEIVVYPRLQDEATFLQTIENQQETLPQLRRGSGVELFSLRPYVQGEDIRMVNWKASARTGELIVRETAVETSGRVWVLLDTTVDVDDETHRTRFEHVVSFLSTMAIELTIRGRQMNLILSHGEEELQSAEGVEEILRVLAVSFLRYWKETKEETHPFNRPEIQEVLPEALQDAVVLCSFSSPSRYPHLSPLIDHYLNLEKLG